MKTITDVHRTEITRIVQRAWPCYVHYADPGSLAGQHDATGEVLTEIAAVLPNSHTEGLPVKVPAPIAVAEMMVLGHEHHAGCLNLAAAITRCLPALTQAVTDRRFPNTSDHDDPHEIRAALASIHGLHHRLDPTGEDDTALIEALCAQSPNPEPIEIGTAWRHMVRLTQDNQTGGRLAAFDYMPMRCFRDLADARNWATLQAMWDCHILGDDPAPKFQNDDYQRIVRELADHDGSDRNWQLPFSNATLRFTSHTNGR